ncbi:hypothetical protein [Microlunatus soli]|nr:hypothetical protein [Microlunatus soli]
MGDPARDLNDSSDVAGQQRAISGLAEQVALPATSAADQDQAAAE